MSGTPKIQMVGLKAGTINSIYGDDDVTFEKTVSIQSTITKNEDQEITSIQITSALPVIPGTLTFDGVSLDSKSGGFYDDGNGNILIEGDQAGTINYQTGVITIWLWDFYGGSYKANVTVKSMQKQVDALAESISGVEEELALLNEGGVE